MKKLLLIVMLTQFTVANAENYAVVTNINNEVTNDTSLQQQLKRLFLKQMRSWNNGDSARVYERPENSPEHIAFLEVVLDMSEIQLAEHWLNLKQKTGETPPRAVNSSKMIIGLMKKYDDAFAVLTESEAQANAAYTKVIFGFSSP